MVIPYWVLGSYRALSYADGSRLTPILARSRQLDGDAVRIGGAVELRVPAKLRMQALSGKIDRDLGPVGNRMQ